MQKFNFYPALLRAGPEKSQKTLIYVFEVLTHSSHSTWVFTTAPWASVRQADREGQTGAGGGGGRTVFRIGVCIYGYLYINVGAPTTHISTQFLTCTHLGTGWRAHITKPRSLAGPVVGNHG